MNKTVGIIISGEDNKLLVRVTGRANFDYAVPLRELAKELDGTESLCVELTDCTAMDSTFMGVMSMLGLKGKRNSNAVIIAGATENIRGLLRGLGVEKLFTFIDSLNLSKDEETSSEIKQDMSTMAETVLEAHQTLVEADSDNIDKFDQVIKLTQKDVDRLKKDKE